MANNDNEKNTIELIQKWLSGKLEIGSEFIIQNSNRILRLINCEGYPCGKLIFDNGEEFNPGKYPKIKLTLTQKESEEEQYDVFEELDKRANGRPLLDDQGNILHDKNGNEMWEGTKVGDEEGPIRKTFVSPQINERYHNFSYYDVSSIIEELVESYKTKEEFEAMKLNLYNYLIYNNYPFFTKEQLKVMFAGCKFEKTKDSSTIKIINGNKNIGYLLFEQGKYIFSPKGKTMPEEYSFSDNKSIGFYYTADSYLDMALSTIEKYKNEFIPIYTSEQQRNRESFGYQNDATIKTILAFSCECYLKALLLNEGKDLSTIKTHGLSELFTTLNDDLQPKIFNYMEMHGYNLKNSLYSSEFETNDLTEQFMLDLARVDDAFIDARYCAENDKNTNYDFLYRFSLALRNSITKEMFVSTPFTTSIDNMIKKH